MNNLDLKEMEASDMLDVLHYFFEEDLYYSSAEQAEGRDRARQRIYEDFYNKRYPYASSSGQGVSRNFDVDIAEEVEEVTPFDPMQKMQPTKPYVAPTPVNASSRLPFGNVLDGPMSSE